MFSILRNRLGIPGLISVIALVFAMFGGAYAASNGSNPLASSSKAAKRGPKGPKGAKGDTGPAGPQGPAGAKGNDGANGSNGTNGKDGANGASVTSTESGSSFGAGHCDGTTSGIGGSKFVVGASTTYACNGKDGEDGESGFTETLPPGATETGTYATHLTPPGTYVVDAEAEPPEKNTTWGEGFASITFSIPLAARISHTQTRIVNVGDTVPTECNGGTVGEPKASPGYLCVYNSLYSPRNIQSVYDPDALQGEGASKVGAGVLTGTEVAGAFAPLFMGTYAVTGCGTGFPCP